MRVTIDLDSRDTLQLVMQVFNGQHMLGKFPDSIRVTRRGYHLLWRGLEMSERESWRIREFLSDDWKRLEIDISSPILKPRQILYSQKGDWTVTDITRSFMESIS